MLKTATRRLLRRAGFEVRRAPWPPRAFPYVSNVSIAGAEFLFWVKDLTAERWYAPEEHARLVENRLLAELVEPGNRILDIGCHQGFYLTFLAKLAGPTGFVLGVDINPENVMITQAQILLNGLTGRCDVLHRAASASTVGELAYSDCTNSWVSSSLTEKGGTAQQTTVDQLCSTYGDFDILMIDVEGFEEEVLKGAEGLLRRKKPKLALEVHSDGLSGYGSSLASLASAAHFSDYTGRMVLRSVDREKCLAFSPSALPLTGTSNVYLTAVS